MLGSRSFFFSFLGERINDGGKKHIFFGSIRKCSSAIGNRKGKEEKTVSALQMFPRFIKDATLRLFSFLFRHARRETKQDQQNKKIPKIFLKKKM
jgi:hypothetical protein